MNDQHHRYYNEALDPEQRIAAMRDEYDRLELDIARDIAALEERKRGMAYGPSRGLVAIRRHEERIAEKEARQTWLHGQLFPIFILGESSNLPGYTTCRSCGAQTGEEAEFERSSLCTRCWDAWTPSSPTTAQTEGHAP